MKTTALSFVVLLLAATIARADWVLVQKVNSDGKEDQVTTKIKGDQARVDMGDKMTVLAGVEGMTVFMHAQKMMMKMDLVKLKALVEAAGKGTGQKAAKPVATGQKEKVGEWETEIYTWEGPMAKGRFWVAKDFPKYKEISALSDKLGKLMGGAMAGMAPQASDFDGMTVKSEMTVTGKNVTSSLISAKQEDLAPSEFVELQGYSEMKMPGAPK